MMDGKDEERKNEDTNETRDSWPVDDGQMSVRSRHNLSSSKEFKLGGDSSAKIR